MRRDLPPLHWGVREWSGLEGDVSGCTRERELRAFLEPWADHLEAPLVVERDPKYIKADVRAEWDDLDIDCGGWAPRQRFRFGRRGIEAAPSPTGEEAAEIRRRQQQAAGLLRSFLREDLPALSWSLPIGGSPRASRRPLGTYDLAVSKVRRSLRGTFHTYEIEGRPRAEAIVRETFDRWGRFLGADVVERRSSGTTFYEINVPGDEFDIGLWASLDLEEPSAAGERPHRPALLGLGEE